MSWERSPICVTVPSEGAICKMGSSPVSTRGLHSWFTGTACESHPAQVCPLGVQTRSGPGPESDRWAEHMLPVPGEKQSL